MARLKVELDRLITLVVGGNAPDRVLAEISRREARIREIKRELQAVAVEPKAWDWAAIEVLIVERAAQIRDILHSEIAAARPALSNLLAEPIKFKPVGPREGVRGDWS